jgi:hypothetical protein
MIILLRQGFEGLFLCFHRNKNRLSPCANTIHSLIFLCKRHLIPYSSMLVIILIIIHSFKIMPKTKSKPGPKKKSTRKYGPKAQKKVKKVMHEYKEGKLKSGRSGSKVKSRKQAIAIGLSEARKSGAKVPKKRTSKKTK